jgi:hypothetical protein
VARASLIRCGRPRARVDASVRAHRVSRARERGARHRRPTARDARLRIVDEAYLLLWRQIIHAQFSLPSSDSADRRTPTGGSRARTPAVPAPHDERPRVRAVCCAVFPRTRSPFNRRSEKTRHIRKPRSAGESRASSCARSKLVGEGHGFGFVFTEKSQSPRSTVRRLVCFASLVFARSRCAITALRAASSATHPRRHARGEARCSRGSPSTT